MKYLGCFYVLTTVNNTAINMGWQISFKIVVLFPLDLYPEVGLLGHMVVLVLICGGISILLSAWLDFTFQLEISI